MKPTTIANLLVLLITAGMIFLVSFYNPVEGPRPWPDCVYKVE